MYWNKEMGVAITVVYMEAPQIGMKCQAITGWHVYNKFYGIPSILSGSKSWSEMKYVLLYQI